jgi:hypothetical protein
MNQQDRQWQKLVAAARRAGDDGEVAAPYGFATRVVAQALARPRPVGAWIERYSWRALGISCLVAVIGVASNYPLLTRTGPAGSEDTYFSADDPAAIVLDVAP